MCDVPLNLFHKALNILPSIDWILNTKCDLFVTSHVEVTFVSFICIIYFAHSKMRSLQLSKWENLGDLVVMCGHLLWKLDKLDMLM